MESIPDATGARKSYKGLAATVIFVVAYFIARGLLEQPDASQTFKIVVALLPVAPFAWMLWEIIKGIRTLDELEQRIQLEALAVAFPVSLVFLMTLGLLEIAIKLPPEDLGYRHVWAMLPLFYIIGLLKSRRRYR